MDLVHKGVVVDRCTFESWCGDMGEDLGVRAGAVEILWDSSVSDDSVS